MARTKNAIITVNSVDVCCPNCGEDIDHEDGSVVWHWTTLEKSKGLVTNCLACGQRVRISFGKTIRRRSE